MKLPVWAMILRVIPFTLFRLRAHGGCDRTADNAYSSMAPDPTFALSEVRVALHSILYMFFWIMITFDTMLTSPFYINRLYIEKFILLKNCKYKEFNSCLKNVLQNIEHSS